MPSPPTEPAAGPFPRTRHSVLEAVRSADEAGRQQAFGVLARRLAAGPGATTITPGDDNADIWFLRDRSGSMSSIGEYVVSGFDGFFARVEVGY